MTSSGASVANAAVRNLYLNSTQGTRFFFDTTLPEIAEFVSRLYPFLKQHVHVTQEHSEGIIPNGSGDVGLTASSSGPSVLGFKNGEECVSAAPPENADTLKKRKRNHE
ncbi:hypothetical protein YC2023_078103 [Brassica napus]